MHKKLLIAAILILPVKSFAQRFSHYFTNTLYESFENPAQPAFKPDSSKMFAFNFFVPNFYANAYLTGNSQATIRQYIFNGYTSNPYLTIGEGKLNHGGANANIYVAMFKIFTSINGKKEIGFSDQIRGEGTTLFTDETAALFDGGSKIQNGTYANLVNDKYYYQSYHQLSFTYRETIDKQFSMGVKLSLLSGIAYDQTIVNNSSFTLDRPIDGTETLTLSMAGRSRVSYDPGTFSGSNLLPRFKHPGLSFSFGVEQHNEDGVHIQYNLKDVGFIHWNKNSNVYNFDNTVLIDNTNSPGTGQNLYNGANAIFQQNGVKQGFTTVTDGRAELSLTKYYALNPERTFKYNPVVVVSKQLFYKGVIGALVNNLQYHNLVLGVSTSYDDLKQINLGGQIMIKSPNAEFFIGSDQLLGSAKLLAANAGHTSFINGNTAYSNAGLFLGFSIKFGQDIESPANASSIPMGKPGFFQRVFKGIFTGKEAREY